METNGNDGVFTPTTGGLVLVDRALCFSLRHGRSDVDSVRREVEFGIVLLRATEATEKLTLAEIYQNPPEASAEATVFSGWTPGDVVQCFRIVQRPQLLEWNIDYLPTS